MHVWPQIIYQTVKYWLPNISCHKQSQRSLSGLYALLGTWTGQWLHRAATISQNKRSCDEDLKFLSTLSSNSPEFLMQDSESSLLPFFLGPSICFTCFILQKGACDRWLLHLESDSQLPVPQYDAHKGLQSPCQLSQNVQSSGHLQSPFYFNFDLKLLGVSECMRNIWKRRWCCVLSHGDPDFQVQAFRQSSFYSSTLQWIH